MFMYGFFEILQVVTSFTAHKLNNIIHFFL